MMTKFTPHHTIADIVTARPDLVDELALAFPQVTGFSDAGAGSHLTIGEAARVAEVSAEALLAYVNGAHAKGQEGNHSPSTETSEGPPPWLQQAMAKLDHLPRLDVRPLSEAGLNPLKSALDISLTVAPKGVFVLETFCEPLPFRRLLAGRGFESHAYKLARHHWLVLFYRTCEDPSSPGYAEPKIADEEELMDLRSLEPPQPMVAILSRIDSPQASGSFSVILSREPVFLFPELEERGWSWSSMAAPEGAFGMTLRRREDSAECP